MLAGQGATLVFQVPTLHLDKFYFTTYYKHMLPKKINSLIKIFTSVKPGFTLIELLIVMAIIGVLAVLLLSSFIGVRERARDGRRKSDIGQLQAALEQYRADNGNYPVSQSGNYLSALTALCPNTGSFTNPSGNSTYMQKIPCDPLGTTSYYHLGNYYYYSDGTIYQLTACLENKSDSQGVNLSSAPDCPTGWGYAKYNP